MTTPTLTRLYNLLHTGNPGDVAYYQQACPIGMRVLELGCGYGRIAAALQRQGCIVEGLDNDAHMLEAFAAAFTSNGANLSPAPRTHLADMRNFKLDGVFDRIVIPFNGLLCMLSIDDVTQVLTNTAAHLKKEGELIFDIYHMPADFENDGLEDEFYIDTTVLDDNGTRVEVYEKTLVSDDPQRFDTSYLFVINAHTPLEKQVEQTIAQRGLYLHQIDACLSQAGLTPVAVHPDFSTAHTRQDITDDTQQIVIHAVIAASSSLPIPTR